MFLAFTFGLVYYYRWAGYRDWLHALFLPYFVGLLGWVAAVVLLARLIWGNRKPGREQEG